MRAFLATPAADLLVAILLTLGGALDLARGSTALGVALCVLAAVLLARAVYRWRSA